MKKSFFQQLKKSLPGIKRNIRLASYTTFKIGGPAKYFFRTETKENIVEAIKMAKKFKLPFFILGGGSNLLIADEGYNGLVIKIQNTKYKIQNSLIWTEAGVALGNLVKASLEEGLVNLEWAAGIPGTVGGAIRGNAGAFGKSIGDMVEEVEVFNIENQKIKKLKQKDCKFDYRDSTFKHKKNSIILSVKLQLREGSEKEIQKKIKRYLNYRKVTQPVNFPSAGSIFKNPCVGTVGKRFSAGELIEKCGLKGKKIGKAQISKIHANFIVNLGGARAKDVMELINLTKKKVKNKFKIILEEEVTILNKARSFPH